MSATTVTMNAFCPGISAHSSAAQTGSMSCGRRVAIIADEVVQDSAGQRQLIKMGRAVGLGLTLLADGVITSQSFSDRSSTIANLFNGLDGAMSGLSAFGGYDALAQGDVFKQGSFKWGNRVLLGVSGTADLLKWLQGTGAIELGNIAQKIGGERLAFIASSQGLKITKGVFLIPACMLSIASSIEGMVKKRDGGDTRAWLTIGNEFGKIMLTAFQFIYFNWLFCIGALATSIIGMTKVAYDKNAALDRHLLRG